MEKSIAQIAFEAYKESTQGKTYDNKPIPEWKDLSQDVQRAWMRAAYAAAQAYTRAVNETTRA